MKLLYDSLWLLLDFTKRYFPFSKTPPCTNMVLTQQVKEANIYVCGSASLLAVFFWEKSNRQ